MKKYTTQKTNSLTKKSNMFKGYNQLKQEINKVEKELKILKKDRENKPVYEINHINDKIYQYREYLKNLNKKLSEFKRKIAKTALLFGVVLTFATSSYGTYIENQNFDENFDAAYHSVQNDNKQTATRLENDGDVLFEQLKLDIEAYTKLSGKEKLTREEKEYKDNLKTRINANPEGITRLSLDILKQKIANAIGAEDYSKIKIMDNSTQVAAGRYHSESGSKTDIAILLDGKTIGTVEKFQSLATGEINTSNDTIPKEVLKVIDKIVHAQLDSQDTKKATKALKASLELEEKDIILESEKTTELNEER